MDWIGLIIVRSTIPITFRANAAKGLLQCQVRSSKGSVLAALDFDPEVKIETEKGVEREFEQLILSRRLSAADVVVTADGYGLNRHEHLDLRKGIHVQGSVL